MNEVHVVGVIKSRWTYNGRLYVRVSLRRSRGRPGRSRQHGGPFDYITIVFPQESASLVHAQPGTILTVHGWLQSRDFDESLRQFVDRAEESSRPEIAEDVARNLIVHRSITEIVAERWTIRARSSDLQTTGVQT